MLKYCVFTAKIDIFPDFPDFPDFRKNFLVLARRQPGWLAALASRQPGSQPAARQAVDRPANES